MPWINAALFLLRSPRARRVVLGLVAGVIAAVGMLIIILVASMGGMFSLCQDLAASTTQPSSEDSSPEFVSSEAPESAVADIPENYMPVYEEAAQEYGIDWAVLAAVGHFETKHGYGGKEHTCVNSSVGAQGQMQFMPPTWGEVGVDANGDGQADPCNYEDAIHSAAKYLVDGGAPGDYQSALFQYNNAQWYVDDVLAKAEEYRSAAGDSGGGDGSSDDSGEPGSTPAFIPPLISPAHAQEDSSEEGGGSSSQAVFPVEGGEDDYSDDWGDERPGFTGGSHEGTDVFAEKGTPIYAMTSGVVEKNATNNDNSYSETGGYNVMIRATEDTGPVKKGDLLLYAHMQEPPAVKVGDAVSAGDEIGKIGATGYGPEVTRDEFDPHLHLGWYDPSGARAETPEGAMNPYPLLQWTEDQSGSSEGSGGSGDSSSSGDSPVTSTPSGGSTLPEYCTPFRVAGLVQDVGKAVGNLGTGEASAEEGSGKIGGGPEKGKELVEAAKKYMGTPYVIGGLSRADCNPNVIDCDCLIYLALQDIGAPTDHLTGDPQQYLQLGEPVEGPPQAGDIIVYDQSGILADVPGGHVAIATGNGNEIVHAIPPETTIDADYSSNQGPVAGIRRIF